MELFNQDVITTNTVDEILAGANGTSSNSGTPSGVENGSVAEGGTTVGGRQVGGSTEGGAYYSSLAGARVEIFPENDNTIGFASYDINGVSVFKTIIDGTDVGDVLFGNYAGGQGIKWDQSAGTLDVQGGVTVDSLDIPDTTTANSFHVDTTGNAWWGATALASGLAWVKKDGTAKFSKTITIGGATTDYQINWDESTLQVNKTTLRFQDLFGDGSDGDVVISGNTTLTSDMYYDDLTVNNGVTLNSGGYRIFVKGNLINNGTIQRTPGSGSGGGNGTTGGACNPVSGGAGGSLGDTSMGGGATGGAGGDARVCSLQNGIAGSNGSNQIRSAGGGAGATAGQGGQVGSSGGAGGTGGTITLTTSPIHNGYLALIAREFSTDDTAKVIKGGASGGGGGSGVCQSTAVTTGSGGGGGSGGGLLLIAAKDIDNQGTISAPGGAGGSGGNGVSYGSAGGGGGGGGGGVLILVYNILTTAGTLTAPGGTGGNGGAAGPDNSYAGANGSNGSAGTVIHLKV